MFDFWCPAPVEDQIDTVEENLSTIADEVVEAAADAVDETVDRAETLVEYGKQSTSRRIGNPIQTGVDVLSGTAALETTVATIQILSFGAELDTTMDAYCAGGMECLTGGLTPKSAITLGHTATFSDDNPGATLIAHEYQHVLDVESVGGAFFYSSYLAHWYSGIRSGKGLDGAYENIYWERRGHAVQHQGAKPESFGRTVQRNASKAATNAGHLILRRGAGQWLGIK